MRIFTLGTDHRQSFDFARILTKHGIEVIFDVRRVPESREPHFCRDGLQQLCSAQNVNYVYLGNELGGPPDGNYRAWIKEEPFQRWFGVIRNKLEKRVCCIMCAERSPEYCHRRVIADELARQGIEVSHLLDENTFWQAPPGRAARRGPQRHGRRPSPRRPGPGGKTRR
jgi:uncharacterized protein (DUF488 family)